MKKINEIFYSIQGEGYRTGTPAVFIRFSGCNLKCPFCDTQHSSGREMSDEEIIKEICFYPTRFVVLTGGEPGLQVDREFINKLHQAGKFIQIETNGTVPIPRNICLLYTSDAADDLLCVDLCGRRMIKKKTKQETIMT